MSIHPSSSIWGRVGGAASSSSHSISRDRPTSWHPLYPTPAAPPAGLQELLLPSLNYPIKPFQCCAANGCFLNEGTWCHDAITTLCGFVIVALLDFAFLPKCQILVFLFNGSNRKEWRLKGCAALMWKQHQATADAKQCHRFLLLWYNCRNMCRGSCCAFCQIHSRQKWRLKLCGSLRMY